MTTIYFIRHAHSPYVHGQEKTRGLSEEGKQMAMKVAQKFKDIDFDGIVSSEYKRAVDTVLPLADAKRIKVKTYKELVERLIKSPDSEMPWADVREGIKKSFSDIDYKFDGGESTRQAQDRAIPVIEKLLTKYKNQTIALGTHGNIMTIILKYYDNSIGYKFWSDSSMPDIYKAQFNDYELVSLERISLS